MNSALKISVAINLILGGAVFWLGLGRESRSDAIANIGEANSATVSAVQSEPMNETNASMEPFRWGRLESTNLQVFVTNLRNVGCPEPTIRDLVSARVHALFAERREQVRNQFSVVPAAGAPGGLQQINAGLERAGLEQLSKEEEAMVESVLHPAAAAGATAGEAAAGAAPAGALISAEDRDASTNQYQVPLYMMKPGPGFEFTDEQLDYVDQVNYWFRQRLGDLDPNDPKYLEQWRWAQPGADAMLRAFMGTEAFMRYQVSLLAAQESAPEGSAPSSEPAVSSSPSASR
jgi:hypothetical protein